MLQLCLFGGYGGPLRPEKKVYFTAFGGSDLMRPTLARRIAWARDHQKTGSTSKHRYFIITLFGGTDIKSPPLAEEFIDLKAMVRSGGLLLREWDRCLAEMHRFENESITSITLFGGLGEDEIPAEDVEIDSLALQRHLGNIPDRAGEILQLGVGQSGTQRTAVIHQAVAAAV
jgi:hypothetical protein